MQINSIPPHQEKALEKATFDSDGAFSALMEPLESEYAQHSQHVVASDNPQNEFQQNFGGDEEEDMDPQALVMFEPVLLDIPTVREAPPVARQDHEVIENLLSTMVEDGRLGKDADGQHVVMMTLKVPGRGDVRVRLWQKPEGVDLKMSATDHETRRLLRRNTGELQQGLAARGVNVSQLEVK